MCATHGTFHVSMLTKLTIKNITLPTAAVKYCDIYIHSHIQKTKTFTQAENFAKLRVEMS